MAEQCTATVRRCDVCGFHDDSFCAARGHCAAAAAQTATYLTVRPADATPGDAGMYFYATVDKFNIGVLFRDAMYQAALERAFGPDNDDACRWQYVALGALDLLGERSSSSSAVEAVTTAVRARLSAEMADVPELAACLRTLKLLRTFDCIAATSFDAVVSPTTNAALESLAATSAGAVLVCHALRQMTSATAAMTRYDNDADVAAAALDVMLVNMEKTGYFLVAGSGELRALVSAMRVATRNLASLSAQLERAWSAMHIVWANGLYKMQCGFLAVGGFELLRDGLYDVADERPAYRCLNAIRHDLRFYLTAKQLLQLTEGVAAAMACHSGCVDVVKAGAVVLSDVCRAVSQGKIALRDVLPFQSLLASVATLVAEEYLDTEAATHFYENEAATFVYDAVGVLVALFRALELIPVLLAAVRSSATKSKLPRHAHLTCAALGEAAANADVKHLSAAVEAVLALLKTHGDKSFTLAKAAVYALSVLCADNAALDVFTVCDGLRVVTSTITLHAKRIEQWLDSTILQNASKLFQLLAQRTAQHAVEFDRAKKEEYDHVKQLDVKYPF